MRTMKRSATEAELPTFLNRPVKRSMCAQTFPSRRGTYGSINGDAAQGQSLLDRWQCLFQDTWGALWQKSVDFTSRVIPEPEMPHEATLPESSQSPASLPSRPPTPPFHSSSQLDTPGLMLVDHISRDSSPIHILSVAPNKTFDTLSFTNDPQECSALKYPKHKHIHIDQHKHKVEAHDRKQLERLRARRTSMTEESDMERILHNYKKVLAAEQSPCLTRQWENERSTGRYGSDFDTYTGFQSYLHMVVEESAQKQSLPVSPSLPDLSRSLAHPIAMPLQRRSSFNLERALQFAYKSLNDQQPLSPISFEMLRTSGLRRDREIDKRIREATRLPTNLPHHVIHEIKLLRLKRGVISKFAREQVADPELARLNPSVPGNWLNDEIINFYGALILDRAEKHLANKENMVNGAIRKRKAKAPGYLNVHYFSTFFWPKIEKGYKEGRLNKWTKKVDVFQKDVILIPVNHGNVHWSLAAINFKRRRLESYDSMGLYRGNVYKTLRTYLNEEHMDKKKKPFDFTGWIDHYDENTPQQENGYDCGVFTCQFMESLSRGVDDFVFDQSDMRYLRDRMTYEIGRGRLWDESDM